MGRLSATGTVSASGTMSPTDDGTSWGGIPVQGDGGGHFQGLADFRRAEVAGQVAEAGVHGHVHRAGGVPQGDEGEAGVGLADVPDLAPDPDPPEGIGGGDGTDGALFSRRAPDFQVFGDVEGEGDVLFPDPEGAGDGDPVSQAGDASGGAQFVHHVPEGPDAHLAGAVVHGEGEGAGIGVVGGAADDLPGNLHVGEVHGGGGLLDGDVGEGGAGGGDPQQGQPDGGQQDGPPLHRAQGEAGGLPGAAVGAHLIRADEPSTTGALAHPVCSISHTETQRHKEEIFLLFRSLCLCVFV
jgi:hypothetical protein